MISRYRSVARNGCKMASSRISELILTILMMVSSVQLQSEEDGIVLSCIAETARFESVEDQFIDRRESAVEGVSLNAEKQIKSFQHNVYFKALRQRPFECIGQHVEKLPGLDISTSLEYKELVRDCISRRTSVSCDSTGVIRTFDGTCNNQKNKDWGGLFRCLRRLLPQNYDGVSGIRKSVRGGPLPLPRQISISVHRDVDRPTQDITYIHTIFGQFLAHDITDVPETFVLDKSIDCCSHPCGFQHPQCDPILIGADDPFYSVFNVSCIDLCRTAPCDTCSIGKRNQMNQVTSYIDLSGTYGLTESWARSLRYGGTKLKVQHTEMGDLMPIDLVSGICGSEQRHERCFLAGDRRTNQQTPLMTVQTLFLREHNRIADELKSLNPHTPDELIYQQARDINIAQMQVIVYNEFLPLLIGSDLMTRYQLWIQTHGCTTYDPNVDATMFAEFNTAAYRLHSMINGVITNLGGKDSRKKLLRNSFRETETLYQGRMGALLEGMCQSPSQRNDRFVTLDMTGFLYKTRKDMYGYDIVSFDIQRGRDNGLPTYADVVHHLSEGKIKINSFQDLQAFMDGESIYALEKIYRDARDIDLWVGMVNEKVPPKMLVGPTAAEIIALQFSNLKRGDRFYFEHCGHTRFNEDQLETIRMASLSSLLCLNTDIRDMQLNAMMFPSKVNPLKCCLSIPKVDLTLFKMPEECKG